MVSTPRGLADPIRKEISLQTTRMPVRGVRELNQSVTKAYSVNRPTLHRKDKVEWQSRKMKRLS